MKTKALFIVSILLLPAAGALAGGEADDASLYRDARDLDLDAPDGGVGDSVSIRQEFGLSSGRRSIDSFLGDFENPYAAPESSDAYYKGTASEARQYRQEQMEKQR